jgi:hypothetical protein
MYAGILLRSLSHAAFATDPLVTREVVISPSALGVAINRGSGVETFWLNYAALSKIGKVLDASGALQVGVKTSDLPIIFDATLGNPDLYIGTSSFTLKGTNVLTFGLKKIKSISNTEIVFTDNGTVEVLTTVNIPNLAQITKAGPVLSSPTSINVSITLSTPSAYVIEAEDGTTLATGTAANTGALNSATFSSARASGARVYAYTIDIHKNRSFRSSILIP